MPVERLDLGPRPRLSVLCRGNLEIYGYPRSETKLESSAPLRVTPREGGADVECSGNCAIRLPQGGRVLVSEAGGHLRVRNLTGGMEAQTVHGSCYLRRIQTVHIREVRGEVRIREISGEVRLGTVTGCITLRDVGGPIMIDRIDCDLLGRNISHGITVGEIGGNLALRTGFEPETRSSVNVRGKVVLHVPSDSSVRFVLAAGIPLDFAQGAEVSEEGGARIVQFGDGAAVVEINGASGVIIRQSGDRDDETAFAYTFAIGNELDEHLASLTVGLGSQFADLSDRLATLTGEMDSQLGAFEATLTSDISERVRRHVEKRLNAARRQVEAAQRHVDRVSEQMGAAEDAPAAGEPVGEAERLAVLQMLEEGQITVEQAEQLLAAMEGEK